MTFEEMYGESAPKPNSWKEVKTDIHDNHNFRFSYEPDKPSTGTSKVEDDAFVTDVLGERDYLVEKDGNIVKAIERPVLHIATGARISNDEFNDLMKAVCGDMGKDAPAPPPDPMHVQQTHPVQMQNGCTCPCGNCSSGKCNQCLEKEKCAAYKRQHKAVGAVNAFVTTMMKQFGLGSQAWLNLNEEIQAVRAEAVRL